jgi:excinuclease ABC subunit A
VVKCADYIIDMGPEGGKGGGEILFEGTPEQLAAGSLGYTAHFLKKSLEEIRGTRDEI